MEKMLHWSSSDPSETSDNLLLMREETENYIQMGSPKKTGEENTICFQMTFLCPSYVCLLC